ncbi:CBO0543 family protein [Metabacillus sp. B2-18]|uniref:CBO0543 family protein n=1 Tax=Metabacillus sp. B2-18 TaxID=2897333 RepID=UPI003FA5D5E3
MIPKNRLREAIATFLFFHMLTWLFSIGLSYTNTIESPIRFFNYATKISFTMEYLVYPTLAVGFQLKFPNTSNYPRRLLHYLIWVGIIVSFMFLIGMFTDIMNMKKSHLLMSFFNFIIELWLCRQFVLWILNKNNMKSEQII